MRTLSFFILVFGLCVFLSQANAGLVISGSRIVYQEGSGDVSVAVRQSADGMRPVLVQAWMDDGKVEGLQQEQAQSVPFLLTPAVFRLEPGRGQNIRVLRAGGDLPSDRESVYWFNVLEVPPRDDLREDVSMLQFSSRARFKFFYRPSGLRGDADKAHQALRFSFGEGRDDGLVGLRIRNPSPYHVTFGVLELRSGDGEVLAEMKPQVLARMVEPMGELVIPLEMVAAAGRQALSGARIHYGIVNDYGATIEGQSRFN